MTHNQRNTAFILPVKALAKQGANIGTPRHSDTACTERAIAVTPQDCISETSSRTLTSTSQPQPEIRWRVVGKQHCNFRPLVPWHFRPFSSPFYTLLTQSTV
ncbi:hypothetical protein M408DRAFT_226481 [Serendipita vermifera MAFF 305830]|uniref:Uncharacterized protein n=1 Tax=Serendipita vermifera MAFF 305830 TaxID=933852 RepID=A0A0C3AKD5_SERVB|nr:hypothetical protein M408DRAFT_226481 [Serendipita vermifera MAFF 305830]